MMINFEDKDIYEKILDLLRVSGINEDIIALADKMDINLPKLFYEKILFSSTNDLSKNVSIVSKTILGVYGNYIATNYYKGLGYNTENEYKICDKDGKLITKADIYFIDNNGKENFCEVKATPQIIDNIRNYVDDSNLSIGSFTDRDNEILKYKNIGKKLIKQVDKLSFNNNKVSVIVFDGCYIDDIILEKLSERNATLRKIAVNINELEDMITHIIYNIRNLYYSMFESIKLKKQQNRTI